MKIDPITGAIYTSMGRVEPGVSRQKLLESNLISNPKELVRNDPWVTYQARLRDDPEFGVLFQFKDDFLVEVRLSITANGVGWGDWSQRGEQEKKEQIDRFLQACLGGPPYKYNWGEVISEIDPKGGFSQAILRYNIPAAVL